VEVLHLSQDGVTLARFVGESLGRFAHVLTPPLPRAIETAVAMGYAVLDTADLPSGYLPGHIEHQVARDGIRINSVGSGPTTEGRQMKNTDMVAELLGEECRFSWLAIRRLSRPRIHQLELRRCDEQVPVAVQGAQ
jgi:hypothetical protein